MQTSIKQTAKAFGLLGICCLLWFSCSPPLDVAGGASDSGNARVAALAVYPDGTPVVGGIVRLRRSDYVAALPALSKTALYGAEATTDSAGRVTITDVDSGIYMLEISDGKGLAIAIPCTVTNRNVLIDKAVNTVTPVGAMTGTVSQTQFLGKRWFVQVFGLERIAVVDSNSKTFLLADIPQGNYSIRLIAGGLDSTPVLVTNVNVPSGGTVIVPAGNGTITGTIGFSVALPLSLTATIIGTAMSAAIDSTGKFTLVNVPAGPVRVGIIMRNAGSNPVLAGIDTVECLTNTTVSVDTIRLVTLPSPCLIDDFESGTTINRLGQEWWTFGDSALGGTSIVSLSCSATPGAGGSNGSAHLALAVDTSIAIPYGGFGTELAGYLPSGSTGTDQSRLASLSFDCKGNGRDLRIGLHSGTQWALNFSAVTQLPAVWTRYSINVQTIVDSLSASDQQTWQTYKRFISQLTITLNPNQSSPTSDLWIDNIEFQYQ